MEETQERNNTDCFGTGICPSPRQATNVTPSVKPKLSQLVTGLKMATNKVANATKIVQLATTNFQVVCRMYQIATKTCELATKFR